MFVLYSLGDAHSVLGHIGLSDSPQHQVIGSVKVFISEIIQSSNLAVDMRFPLEGTVGSLLLQITARYIVKEKPTAAIRSSEAESSGSDPLPSPLEVHTPLKSESLPSQQAKATEDQYPKLSLGIRFNRERSKLVVEVDKVSSANLVIISKMLYKIHLQAEYLTSSSKLHPYVVVKLQPDNVKKKTEAVKPSVGGSVTSLAAGESVDWKKLFEFSCSASEISSKTLEVTVKNNLVFPKSDAVLGYVLIPLHAVPLDEPFHSFFGITPKP